ncbi:hypothetical protein FRC00_011362, partial [Tulasnella sp. 408]
NYVKIALQTARAADPVPKLYIEEYGAEPVNAKSNALYALVQTLKTSGIPIDGVGFEGHITAGSLPNIASVTANVARFVSLNLDWAFTRAFPRPIDAPSDPPRANFRHCHTFAELGVRIVNGAVTRSRQLEDYVALFIVCLNSPKCVGAVSSGIVDTYTIEGTSFWGGPSWTETLFDANYQTVLAYYGIADKLTTATLNGSYA